MKHLISLGLVLALSACSDGLSNPFKKQEPNSLEPAVGEQMPAPTVPAAVEPGTSGQTAATLDRVTPEAREAATTGSQSGAPLGQTVASLGDPGQVGFWLKTSLVTAAMPGRLETGTGSFVNVTLLPIENDAGGSEISLSAMRALGLDLTALPSLQVFGG